MKHPGLLPVLVFAIFFGRMAMAEPDPECLGPGAADQTVWHLEDGDGCYCTSLTTLSGTPVPDGGQTCSVSIDGEEFDVRPFLDAGKKICISSGSFYGVHPVKVTCSVEAGEGTVVATGSFPADVPLAPVLQ